MSRFLIDGRWMLAWTLVVSLAGVVRAEDERQTIDPEADKIVKAAADYLAGLKSFSVEVAVTQKVAVLGQKMEMNSDYNLAFRRPDHVAFVLKEGINGMTMISNGEKLWQYMPALRRYTETDAPENVNEALATAGGAGPQGPDAVVAGLTGADPYEAIMAGVTGLKLVGSEEIDGEKCHHLQAYQDDMDWQMWIAEGDTPLVRRFLPDVANMLEQLGGALPGGGGQEMKLEMEVTVGFNNWSADAELADDLFVFDPPQGVEKVDQLFDLAGLMKGLGGAGDGDEGEVEEEMEEPSLLGRDAPNFELATLDDKTLDLEALKKDEDIVILDFWATWCGPCVKALPLVSKVAEEFADKGVKFYAVNFDEDADTIEEFLAEKKLDIAVALDAGGDVTKLYGVSAIPQTVVIGRNGTVQAIHIGFSEEVADTLRQELTALLDGQDLAAKALVGGEEADDEQATEEPAPEEPASAKKKQPKKAAEADAEGDRAGKGDKKPARSKKSDDGGR
jgi:thiol-disulfide isomerase/thioredoxin